MWLRVHIHISPEGDAEGIAAALWDIGAGGCEIQDAETSMTPRDDAEIIAYFPIETTIPTVTGFLEAWSGATCLGSAVVEDQAWAEGYKQHFKATRVSARIAVHPPWDHGLPPGRYEAVVVIDPGMAFGTGTHETTRLCLEAIDELLLASPDTHLLDVGCGSGILSIAAAQLGARVTAIDNDPDAVRVARENWLKNAGLARRSKKICLEPSEMTGKNKSVHIYKSG